MRDLEGQRLAQLGDGEREARGVWQGRQRGLEIARRHQSLPATASSSAATTASSRTSAARFSDTNEPT